MRQVKLLDLIVVTLFHGQDNILCEWRVAQQVEDVRERKRNTIAPAGEAAATPAAEPKMEETASPSAAA